MIDVEQAATAQADLGVVGIDQRVHVVAAEVHVVSNAWSVATSSLVGMNRKRDRTEGGHAPAAIGIIEAAG
jgi:hypothetical protein